MKKYLLISTLLLISSLCWAQFDINKLAKENPEYPKRIPEYAKRISAVSEFLTKTGIILDKDHMDLRINKVENNNLYYFTSDQGEAVIVVESCDPNAQVVIYPEELFRLAPNGMIKNIRERVKLGEKLTDVFNFSNEITTTDKTDNVGRNSRMIREITMMHDNSEDERFFTGPVVILVTLSPAKQLFVEQNTFKKMSIIDFSERYARDAKFKNAYDYLMYRLDFKNTLALFIGAKEPYVSDVALVDKIMDRLSSEINKNSSSISEESIRVLSHPQMLEFIETVSESYPEYTDLYSLVKLWNENFAKYAMDVIALDPKDDTKEYRKTGFLECLARSIEIFKAEHVK